MAKFDGVLLASDFDNTLADSRAIAEEGGAEPSISAKNKAALRYFMENGGRFSVATGRALPAFAPFASSVPMNAPCILFNGAAIYDFSQKEYVCKAFLGDEVRPRVGAVMAHFPDLAVEIYHADNSIHAVRPNEVTLRHQHITHVCLSPIADAMDAPLPFAKVLFEATPETLAAVVDYLAEKGWANDYETLFSNKYLLEVTAKGANKGGMLLRLAALLDISRAHIYCIGDHLNDLPMFAVAKQAFAPANCLPALREAGAHVVSDCGHDALADVVEALDRLY